MKKHYLLPQDEICCGLIKSIKFANCFIKVFYRSWHFNDVYSVLEETKISVWWQFARTGTNCAYNYAIKLLKVVRNLYKIEFELF